MTSPNNLPSIPPSSAPSPTHIPASNARNPAEALLAAVIAVASGPTTSTVPALPITSAPLPPAQPSTSRPLLISPALLPADTASMYRTDADAATATAASPPTPVTTLINHLPQPPISSHQPSPSPQNEPHISDIPSSMSPPLTAPHPAISPLPALATASNLMPPTSPDRFATASTTPGKRKRPHRSISHAEKRRLCEISDAHPNARHNYIASIFRTETGRRIERSTVTRVLQRKHYWMNAGSRDGNRKRQAHPRFPSVEEALFELIRNRTISPALRAKLTDKELMSNSKEIADSLRSDQGNLDKSSPNYTPHLRSFRGSLSWITSFKKRCALIPNDELRQKQNRMFSSQLYPGETLDIWKTDMNVLDTREIISNWTRLEDLYFLEAVVFASSALPENAVESPIESQSASAAVDAALDIGTNLQNDRNPPNHVDMSVPGFPTLNFSLPSIMDTAPQNPMQNNHDQQGFAIANDAFGAPPNPMDSETNGPAHSTRHEIDEDSMIISLVSSNGTGSDRPDPWIVGKAPQRQIGKLEGEVWHNVGVRYFHNVRGWLTGRLVRKWMQDFDKTLDRSVVVLTSLLNACDLELLDLKFVTVIPMPKVDPTHDMHAAELWKDSRSSPMHHGIEQVFRTKFRTLVLERALQFMGRGVSIKPVPLRTASAMVKEAWDKVPNALIRRAWRDVSYLPAKLQMCFGQRRVNARAMCEQQVDALRQLIVSYRDAIESYPLADAIDLRYTDVQAAAADPKKYIWLPGELTLFHPKGTILDFVRSVCSVEINSDESSDDETQAIPQEKEFPKITKHAEALEAVNKLAEYVRSCAGLGNEQNLYLVGSLQLAIKKVFEDEQNEAQANNWTTANVQDSD